MILRRISWPDAPWTADGVRKRWVRNRGRISRQRSWWATRWLWSGGPCRPVTRAMRFLRPCAAEWGRRRCPSWTTACCCIPPPWRRPSSGASKTRASSSGGAAVDAPSHATRPPHRPQRAPQLQLKPTILRPELIRCIPWPLCGVKSFRHFSTSINRQTSKQWNFVAKCVRINLVTSGGKIGKDPHGTLQHLRTFFF